MAVTACFGGTTIQAAHCQLSLSAMLNLKVLSKIGVSQKISFSDLFKNKLENEILKIKSSNIILLDETHVQ